MGCSLVDATLPTLRYDTGTFLRVIALHYHDKAAVAAMRRANRLLDRLQRHRPPVDSAAYTGGRFRAFSFSGLPPARFPARRPQYS